MIALNRKMPQTCLECPCLWTLGTISDEKTEATYAARFCAASHKEICIYREIEDFPLPDSFYNFLKPEWCPWKEIHTDEEKDEEYAWRMSISGLGGSYE